jgi:type II secretory pathway pseudopilin PulG
MVLSRTLGRSEGFTIVELGIVTIIIGIMLGAVVVSYFSATRRTEVLTVTEQIKEEIRKTYALADSGETTAGVKHQYRITFNDNSGTPKNAYKVEKSTDGGNSWAVVPPYRGTAYKVVSTDWMQPATQGDCQIFLPGNPGSLTIRFSPMGSIMKTYPDGDKEVDVTSVSQNTTQRIIVNDYGSIEQL